MTGMIVAGVLRLLLWSLAAGGLAALVLAVLIATPLRQPPDELMVPDNYQEAVGPRVPVRLIDGINHMEIVSAPAAVSAIADDVAKAGSGA